MSIRSSPALRWLPVRRPYTGYNWEEDVSHQMQEIPLNFAYPGSKAHPGSQASEDGQENLMFSHQIRK